MGAKKACPLREGDILHLIRPDIPQHSGASGAFTPVSPGLIASLLALRSHSTAVTLAIALAMLAVDTCAGPTGAEL